MKEDVLEQIVDDYLLRIPSTFTKHNIKFKPNSDEVPPNLRNKYAVNSDIDVLAIHLNKKDLSRVVLHNCKSWQNGFDVKLFNDNLPDKKKRLKVRVGNAPMWKKFREFVDPYWAKALRETIYKETNSYDFTYCITVTKINKGEYIDSFCSQPEFLSNLSDDGKHCVKISFLTLSDIFYDIYENKNDTVVENSEIGRMIQLFKAAGLASRIQRNNED